MHRKRVLFIAALLFALFFVNVSFRNTSKTVVNRYDPSENIPLLLLGGLRGIAVDFLWARAIARHEEKKYYELLTINNLIAKLQPNFPAVWIFQAWNMAYNIAHEWDAARNKWKWVHAGLDFAKKGTVKNPASGDMFFEIGYMYLHLFDQRFFKYAPYYRERLKQEDGEDNYDAALYWLRRSLLHDPKFHNVLAIKRTICHAQWYASQCAEREGNIDKALQYVASALNEWETYQKEHPEDTATNVAEFIDTVGKKKELLQNLMKKDVW